MNKLTSQEPSYTFELEKLFSKVSTILSDNQENSYLRGKAKGSDVHVGRFVTKDHAFIVGNYRDKQYRMVFTNDWNLSRKEINHLSFSHKIFKTDDDCKIFYEVKEKELIKFKGNPKKPKWSNPTISCNKDRTEIYFDFALNSNLVKKRRRKNIMFFIIKVTLELQNGSKLCSSGFFFKKVAYGGDLEDGKYKVPLVPLSSSKFDSRDMIKKYGMNVVVKKNKGSNGNKKKEPLQDVKKRISSPRKKRSTKKNMDSKEIEGPQRKKRKVVSKPLLDHCVSNAMKRPDNTYELEKTFTQKRDYYLPKFPFDGVDEVLCDTQFDELDFPEDGLNLYQHEMQPIDEFFLPMDDELSMSVMQNDFYKKKEECFDVERKLDKQRYYSSNDGTFKKYGNETGLMELETKDIMENNLESNFDDLNSGSNRFVLLEDQIAITEDYVNPFYDMETTKEEKLKLLFNMEGLDQEEEYNDPDRLDQDGMFDFDNKSERELFGFHNQHCDRKENHKFFTMDF